MQKKRKYFYKSLYKIKNRAIIDVSKCKRFHKNELVCKKYKEV
ncbi:hypothetical protein HMPREF9389_2295 [Streptococcus sanguinis SK355]|uniref:Uncharacterized protein n=1 Tax=Streptococcus sanguinis SK355 TaxID=888816 RepID=F3UTY7_STRSA|nr:hypothetical protein HMPREF9389_2295 [Streptococcus sanguinis SK355]